MPCLHIAAHGHTCTSSPREGPGLASIAMQGTTFPVVKKGGGKGGGGGGQIIRDSKKKKKKKEVIAGIENHEARALLQSAENRGAYLSN